MKFVCSQKKLNDAISVVQKAVSSRTTIPILEGVYIETLKDTIKLIGTNLNLGIEVYIEADVTEKNSIVLPSKVFGDLVRKLPDADVSITVMDRHRVKIQCLNSTVTLQGLNSDEYPSLQQIQEDQPVEIQQDLLKSIIQDTIFAVATDETRSIFTGALFEMDGESLNVVCMDGYRVSLRRAQIRGNNKRQQVVIPGKSLSEISKILGGSDQKVSLTISDRHALFDLGYTRVITRLLEGDYLNYHQIIPQEYQTRVKVDTDILTQSIERASLLASDGFNKLIKFIIREDKLVITSNSEVGEAYEEIPILLEGKELEIAFNARYFLDILRVIDDQEICIDFISDVSPCTIRPLEGDKYTYLLLPVRNYR